MYRTLVSFRSTASCKSGKEKERIGAGQRRLVLIATPEVLSRGLIEGHWRSKAPFPGCSYFPFWVVHMELDGLPQSLHTDLNQISGTQLIDRAVSALGADLEPHTQNSCMRNLFSVAHWHEIHQATRLLPP